MEPRLAGVDYAPRDGERVQAEEESREEKIAANKRLVASFGSTRRRRQLQSREEGIVHGDWCARAAA